MCKVMRVDDEERLSSLTVAELGQKIWGCQIIFFIFLVKKKLFILSSFLLLKTSTDNSRIQKKYDYYSLLYHDTKP